MGLTDTDKQQFDALGYIVVPNTIDSDLVATLKQCIIQGLQAEEQFAGLPQYKQGFLPLAPFYSADFLSVLETPAVMDAVDGLLGRPCVLHAYAATQIVSELPLQVYNPRFIPNYLEGVVCIIPLDDLTTDNGTLQIIPGSHLAEQKPDGEGEQITAKAGSALIMNSRVWYAQNTGKQNTRPIYLSLAFYLPHIKQLINMEKALASLDLSQTEDYVKYKLGFFTNPPATAEEYEENGRRLQGKS
jgi:ectoine hydroxylase-related dioxygenase (phytanoyl-CoA dioxygenase family)